MQRIFAAVLAVSACASPLRAQVIDPAASDHAWSLDAAVRAAEAVSPNIDAARAGLLVGEAQRGVARQRRNPSLEGMAENVGGTGAYRGFRSTETTIGLALPIELGGKRPARIAVADAQSARIRIDAVMAAADLRLRVTQAFTDAAAAQQRLGVTRDQQRIAADGLRVAAIRVRAGSASPLEQQRADVVRINADTAADRARRTAAAAFANLGALVDAEVRLVDAAWFDRVVDPLPDRPETIERTLAATMARADIATADAQLRLARSQRVPDVTISASARRLNATNDVSAVFALSVPLPLFDTGRARVQLATAQRDQSEALRRVAVLDVRRSITSAQTEVANAAASARAASGPALAAATEAARIARIGYREGKFGQLDLLEAERTLAATRSEMIDALAAYHDAAARLERLAVTTPAIAKDDR
jgi:cobalt-zinc-cadmium efflux system outer membrane protein